MTIQKVRIETEKRDDFVVFRVADTVDVNGDISALIPCVEQALAKGNTHIAFAFTPDSFLYSKSVGVLIECLEMIRIANGNAALISPNADIVDCITAVGLLHVTHILD